MVSLPAVHTNETERCTERLTTQQCHAWCLLRQPGSGVALSAALRLLLYDSIC